MPLVVVHGVPPWVDATRLLGDGWSHDREDGAHERALDRDAAADLAASLRGLGLGGRPLRLEVSPPLKRKVVRDGRSRDARRRRNTTPGFTRPQVRLDDEGRRSLTPEVLALAIGRRAARAGCLQVVDATCGSGGNSIGFARAGCTVTAVELDPQRAADARHNTEIYGVGDRVDVRVGRAEHALGGLSGDLVFVDPPWGSWNKLCTGLTDVPLLSPILAAVGSGPAVWCKLPPSFDPAQLPEFTFEAWFGHGEGDRHRIKFVLASRASVAI